MDSSKSLPPNKVSQDVYFGRVFSNGMGLGGEVVCKFWPDLGNSLC